MTTKMLCVDDYEREFGKLVHPLHVANIDSGNNAEHTLNWNKQAFKRLRIRPRLLRDVSSRDLSISLLGSKIDFPIGISPTSMHIKVHPDGEIAMAKAAQSVNACMIVSQHTTVPFEQIAEATPDGLKWANVYIFPNREITRDMVTRVERNGYKAIVVTIDNPSMGFKLRPARLMTPERRERFLFDSHGSLQKHVQGETKVAKWDFRLKAGITARDPKATWEYIDWLRSLTQLPIVLKGILTAEDAILAVQHGANAVMVSNHGGRALDCSPATIEALPEIVRAVGDQIDVYVDGGVRTGHDVFKALALGAKAVFVGRPSLYGLAHSGEAGVKHVLEILKEELDMTMQFAGCRSLSDITSSFVVHESYYAKL